MSKLATVRRALWAPLWLPFWCFFILEKGLIWRHHHHHGGHDHDANVEGPAGTLILIGDSVHNFLDGILIAAAFLADSSPRCGYRHWTVIAHEVPQELGDFAILLHSGYSRKKAFIVNLLSSAAMVAGATLAWFGLGQLTDLIPYLLAFTAASFIYVAVSDLMPALNRKVGLRETVVQVLLIGSGLGLNMLIPHRLGATRSVRQEHAGCLSRTTCSLMKPRQGHFDLNRLSQVFRKVVSRTYHNVVFAVAAEVSIMPTGKPSDMPAGTLMEG